MTTVAASPKSASAAARPAAPPPTSAPMLDEAVARVREGAGRLLRLTLDDRMALARSMQTGYLAIARESVHAACAAKGIPLDTPLEGEEWTLGPWFVVRHLRLVQMNCDIGHLFCVGDDPADVIRKLAPHVAHLHLEDIGKNRVHQHLTPGKGAIDFRSIFAALDDVRYAGWVTVELYPYETTAAGVAKLAYEHLAPMIA